MVVTSVIPKSRLWQRILLVLPSLYMAIAFPVGWGWGGAAYGVISAYAALAVLFDWPGRFWGLAWSFMLGIACALFLTSILGPLSAILVFAVVGVGGPLLAFRIGQPWGHARAMRLRQARRGIRESQWVYVGAEVAGAHPLAGGLGAVWVVAVFILLQLAGVWMSAIILLSVWTFVYAFVATAFVALLFTLLIKRHPAAWPLTWIPLSFAIPVSFPLMMYWADGIRPNLIYRHRFERLLPSEGHDVP